MVLYTSLQGGRLRLSLSAQKSAQEALKRVKALKRVLFAQKSAQKSGSAQKTAQERVLLSDSLKRVLF